MPNAIQNPGKLSLLANLYFVYFLGKDLSVYVAGWGRLFDQCSTNELGPVRNLKCAEAKKMYYMEDKNVLF
jgi:hypothetical protein